MPLGNIAGEVLGSVVRLIAEVFVLVVIEVMIKRPGYLICRMFWRADEVDPKDFKVLVVGLLFWLAIIAGGDAAYRHIATPGA
jgi:hypothetical protein